MATVASREKIPLIGSRPLLWTWTGSFVFDFKKGYDTQFIFFLNLMGLRRANYVHIVMLHAHNDY